MPPARLAWASGSRSLMGLGGAGANDDPDRRLPPRRRQDRDRGPDLLKPGPLSDEEYARDAAARRVGAGIVSTHVGDERHRVDRPPPPRAVRRCGATRTGWPGHRHPARRAHRQRRRRVLGGDDDRPRLTARRRSEDEAWDELRAPLPAVQFDPAIVELFEAAVRLDEMASAAAATEAARRRARTLPTRSAGQRSRCQRPGSPLRSCRYARLTPSSVVA